MFFPEGTVRVHLYGEPVDMRRSYDGLYALTRHKLGCDPLSGELFVLINRRGTQMKVLYQDRTGFCVWAKRLEQGRFVSDWPQIIHRRTSEQGIIPLSMAAPFARHMAEQFLPIYSADHDLNVREFIGGSNDALYLGSEIWCDISFAAGESRTIKPGCLPCPRRSATSRTASAAAILTRRFSPELSFVKDVVYPPCSILS